MPAVTDREAVNDRGYQRQQCPGDSKISPQRSQGATGCSWPPALLISCEMVRTEVGNAVPTLETEKIFSACSAPSAVKGCFGAYRIGEARLYGF